MKELANIVGLQNLRAPWYQNECVDIILLVNGEEIRISLKTASENNNSGYQFGLKAHPNSKYCDYVFAFYWSAPCEENRVLTHISVIDGSCVYVPHRVSFCWSKTNNKDVLENCIDVSSVNTLEALIKVVSP